MQFATLLVATVFASLTPLYAGDWHYGAHLVCSDCHTNHNSAGGQPMRYDAVADPATYLLRSDTAQTLCLSCHDGASASAPDVMGSVAYVSESAAGAFANPGGIPVSTAHNLNSPPVVPPGGTKTMVLLCTTCHDPHGNTNYRNLRPDPARDGITQIDVVATQSIIADGNNPAAVYVSSNIIYKSGISAWCQSCHSGPIGAGDHPVDRPIFGTVLASYSHWQAVTPARVPVNSPDDNVIPSSDDRVTCLTCHKAHGSPNRKALIYADGVSLTSTCQECHDE